MRVSPDGRRVAYLRHPHVDDDGGDVVVIDVATKRGARYRRAGSASQGSRGIRTGNGLWFTASQESLANTLHRVRLDGTLADVTCARAGPPAPPRRSTRIAARSSRSIPGDCARRPAMHDRSQSNISWVSDLSADGKWLLLGELGSSRPGPALTSCRTADGRALRLGPGFPAAISPSRASGSPRT